MAKRNKREMLKNMEGASENSVEADDVGGPEINADLLKTANEKEAGNSEEVAKLKESLSGKYAKGAGRITKKVAKKVIADPLIIAGKIGVGAGLEGVSGSSKAVKGIFETVKDTLFNGGGDFFDLVLPKEIKDSVMRGFKTARGFFNKEDKKDKK